MLCALAVGTLLWSGASPAWAGEPSVTSVELIEAGDSAVVEVRLSERAEFQAERRMEPLRYVVELPSADLAEALVAAPTLFGAGATAVSKVLVLSADEDSAGGATLVVYLSDRVRVKADYRADGVLAIAVNGPPVLTRPEADPVTEVASTEADAGAETAVAAPVQPIGVLHTPGAARIEEATAVDAPPAEPEANAPAAPEAPAARATLSGVRVCAEENGAVRVAIEGDAPLTYETRADGDTTFVVDIKSASVAADLLPVWAEADPGNIEDVRVETLDGEGARVTVDCKSKVRCLARAGESDSTIVVEVPAPLDLGTVVAVDEGAATTTVAAPELTRPGMASESSDWGNLAGDTRVSQGGYQTIPGPRRPGATGGRGPAENIGDASVGVGGSYEPGPGPGLARVPGFLSEGTISLDFTGDEVRNALLAIANYADVDMVIDESVAGTITISMAEVTAEEAITLICGIKDLAWAKRGSTYVVATRERITVLIQSLPEDERAVVTYHPVHQDEQSLTQYETLVKSLHPRVLVQTYQNPGALVLAGDVVDVEEAMETLRKADVMREGNYSENQTVELYTVESGSVTELASFLQQVYGEDLQVIHRAGTNQIVLKGWAADVVKAKELLAQMDREGGQVATVTYKPVRHTPAVVEAALKAQFPHLQVGIKTVDDTIIITGTQTDTAAVLQHARAIDLSMARPGEATAEYTVQSRYVRGLQRLARQSCPDVEVTALPETKTLVITGEQADVDACIERLRTWDNAATTDVVTENHKVEYQDPMYIAETLTGLDLDPGFAAQPSGQMLALTGPSVVVSEAVAILEELDQQSRFTDYGRDLISERYVLRYAEVTEALQMLSAVFGEKQDVQIQLTGESTPSAQIAMEKLYEAQGIPTTPPAPAAAEQAPENWTVFGQNNPFGGGLGDIPPASPPGGILDGARGGQGLGQADQGGLMGALGQLGSGQGAPSEAAPETPGGAQAAAGATGTDVQIWLAVGADTASHALLLVGPRWAVRRGVALLEQFDVAPDQIVLECLIADVNRTYLKDKGVSWDWGGETISESPNGFSFGSFARAGLNFNANFFLDEENGASKLLATPNIRCRDGKHARIQIGDTLRYRVAQPTTPVTYSTEETPVGVILEVTPRVTGDGRVVLDLQAESSSISGYVDELPQIRTRNTETEIVVRDGETIVLGGLIREEEVETLSEVPFLSEIPILGQLFRHRSVDKRPQELVFFITPRVLYAHDDTLQDDYIITDAEELGPGGVGWTGTTVPGATERIDNIEAALPEPADPREAEGEGDSGDEGQDSAWMPGSGALARRMAGGK